MTAYRPASDLEPRAQLGPLGAKGDVRGSHRKAIEGCAPSALSLAVASAHKLVFFPHSPRPKPEQTHGLVFRSALE